MYNSEQEVFPSGYAAAASDVRVISVTSGKGGVGKTNVVVNLAIALSKAGKRCLVLDADLGLGNIDVLLGITPEYNIGHVLRGEKTISEVVMQGPFGIMILPASSGVYELTELSAEQRLAIVAHLEAFSVTCGGIDVMLIDTGAGISSNVLFFNTASREIVVVVTPEPTAITDAYALMKALLAKHGEKSFKLIVNSVRSKKEGLEVYRNISSAADKFLNVSIDYLGCVFNDDSVPKSVVRQKAVMELFPESKASVGFGEIAAAVLGSAPPEGLKGGLQLFWRRVVNRDY